MIVKSFSIQKAREIKRRICLSIFCIWFPLLGRSMFNLIRFVTEFDRYFVFESLENNTFSYPLFVIWYLSFADFIPIIFQLYSLRIIIHNHWKILDEIIINKYVR